MNTPPFCPNPECRHHHTPSRSWYRKHGSYRTQCFGTVPRYRCCACKHTFSSQSFSIDYYAKRKLSYSRILTELVGCSSSRHMSRVLKVSCATIQNRVARLSRNALAMHEHAVSSLQLSEHLAADGFESFTRSHFHPNNIHLLVGRDSQFVYFWNETTIRRKGRMSPGQHRHRASLERRWKASLQGISRSFAELCLRVADLVTRSSHVPCVLDTDDHTRYPKVIRTSVATQHLMTGNLLIHRQTSSRVARTRSNPLFPVNYIDREIRKDMHNHVRKTVCHARNQSNMMQRLSLYLWHHNYRKPHRIVDRAVDMPLHAEQTGISKQAIDRMARGFFSRRSFLSRSIVTGSFAEMWRQRLVSPMKHTHDYCPHYALV